MSRSEPARIAARRLRSAILAAVACASATLIGTSSASSSLGGADGAVRATVTVFDDVPAVTHLDRGLREALRKAATDAARNGVGIAVNSGWRSPAYQRHLLDDAVSRYGSRRKATRWVASPDRSSHVSGHAVDVGPADATAWLSRHGARYGLCRIYRNEPWHYELRPDARGDGCPAMYADPTHDPRMQP